MQLATIAGTLVHDAESLTDAKGTNFLRFTVKCKSKDKKDRIITNLYTCYCYIKNATPPKEGDKVFVSGKLSLGVQYDDDNNPYPHATIVVTSMDRGEANKK